MEQTSAKRISSRSGSLHAVVTRLSAAPESLARVAAAWLAGDEAGRLVTTFRNVVRELPKFRVAKNARLERQRTLENSKNRWYSLYVTRN